MTAESPRAAWQLVTPPVAEPVTLSEAKLHLRVDGSAEDALIALYVQAARQALEEALWRSLMTQTWQLALDEWPETDNWIELPRPPVQSVSGVTYRDNLAVTHTLPSSNYHVDTYAEPGRIVLAYGRGWPTTALDTNRPIRITYVAGYASAANVPALVRAALLLQVADYYANREAVALSAATLSDTVRRTIPLAWVR